MKGMVIIMRKAKTRIMSFVLAVTMCFFLVFPVSAQPNFFEKTVTVSGKISINGMTDEQISQIDSISILHEGKTITVNNGSYSLQTKKGLQEFIIMIDDEEQKIHSGTNVEYAVSGDSSTETFNITLYPVKGVINTTGDAIDEFYGITVYKKDFTGVDYNDEMYVNEAGYFEMTQSNDKKAFHIHGLQAIRPHIG